MEQKDALAGLNIIANMATPRWSFPFEFEKSWLNGLWSSVIAISSIDVMHKIFSGILNKRIYRRSENFDFIDESHARFRSGLFIFDHLFRLQSMIKTKVYHEVPRSNLCFIC